MVLIKIKQNYHIMSNAKQKAEELVDKYMNCEFGAIQEYIPIPIKLAKQCAIIAVDEILNINSVDKDYDLSEYWQQVKTEIENL